MFLVAKMQERDSQVDRAIEDELEAGPSYSISQFLICLSVISGGIFGYSHLGASKFPEIDLSARGRVEASV